jgi:hypothetical protein
LQNIIKAIILILDRELLGMNKPRRIGWQTRLASLAMGVAAAAGAMPAFGAVPVACASSGTQITGASLPTTLSGNTVCVGTSGNWSNQEFHAGSGSIVDYKMGPNDPKDPTATIGVWSVSGDAVTYSYTAGGTFTFTVWQHNDGTLDFCDGPFLVVTGATLRAGSGPCSPPA